MHTKFEKVGNIFVRHSLYAYQTRSVLAAFAGDLSPEIEIEFAERPCCLCLLPGDTGAHTLALHNRQLQQEANVPEPTATMAPDARASRMLQTVSSLPFPLVRKPR